MALPPQIQKLIPRLASTHEGEVVATAAAIGRVLAAAGSDWHDVAKACAPATTPVKAAEDGPSYKYNGFTWYSKQQMRDAHTDQAKAVWLSKYGGFWLTEREKEFAHDLARDLTRYRGGASFKQKQWLQSLFDRLRRAAL